MPEILTAFGKNNALLAVGDKSRRNIMTIGWCGLGRMWNLPSCTIYVRPERYTYSFLETHEYFTLSVLPAEYRGEMNFCGTKSGRDVDKFLACGLTVQYGAADAPFPAEAEWAIVCKKRYAQDLGPGFVLDEKICGFYRDEGWHRMYIGEITEAYKK